MSQFLLNVAAGVTTTVFAAGLVFAGNYIRNELLERRLKDAFATTAAGQSIGGFQITLTNSSWVPVTVRQIFVYFDYPKKAVELHFARFAPYQFKGDSGLRTGEGGLLTISELHESPAPLSPHGFVSMNPGVGG